MHMRTRKLALTEGAAAGVFFGTAAIFIRFLQGLDAFSVVFWRLIVACSVLALILVLSAKPFLLKLVRENLRDLLILSFFLGLHFIFFVSSVKDTTILNATVLVNTTPIFSVIISGFVFKLRPSRIAVLGLTISFIGLCVIAYAEAAAQTDEASRVFSSSIRGDLEAVMAAFVESFYLNYGRKVRAKMDLLPTMLPIYLLTAVFVGAISMPVMGRTMTLPADVGTILPLVGLGVIPTAAAHTLYFSSLSNLKPFETATMALLEPIGATTLGVALFQEAPPLQFVLGAALILSGIFFVIKNRISGHISERQSA